MDWRASLLPSGRVAERFPTTCKNPSHRPLSVSPKLRLSPRCGPQRMARGKLGVTRHKNSKFGVSKIGSLLEHALKWRSMNIRKQAWGSFCQALTCSLTDSLRTPEETFVNGEIIGRLSQNTPNSKLIASADGQGDGFHSRSPARSHTSGPRG